MTKLSTTEAKLIEQAAKKHAEGTCTGKQYGGTTDLIVPKIKEWAAYDFTAGASFATTSPDILREILKSFCEFIANLDGEQKLFLIDHDWYWDLDKEGDAPISSEQLADRYIQHLQTNKQKNNEQG